MMLVDALSLAQLAAHLIYNKLFRYEIIIGLLIAIILYQLIKYSGIFYYLFEAAVNSSNFLPNQNYLENHGVPYTSWHQSELDVSVYAIQGRRPGMEDRFDIRFTKNSKYSYNLYAVYDGHGGSFSADFLAANLLKSLNSHINTKFDSGYTPNNGHSILSNKEIISFFNDADGDLYSHLDAMNDMSGSTALVIMLYNVTKLLVANVGDCRAVMYSKSGKMTALTTDHKPNSPLEKQRIEDAGGYVTFNGVWRVMGVLATSRAFGDVVLKDTGTLVTDPEIDYFELDKDAWFVVIASDGLWDVFTSEEAVDFLKTRISEKYHGARSLALEAYHRGSMDNITVMVIQLDTQMRRRSMGDQYMIKDNSVNDDEVRTLKACEK